MGRHSVIIAILIVCLWAGTTFAIDYCLGKGDGKKCVIPFKDGGKTYKKCAIKKTNSNRGSHAWCATSVDGSQNYKAWEWFCAPCAEDCGKIAVSDRRSCGNGRGGISREDCNAKNCCFDDTKAGIWCFYP